MKITASELLKQLEENKDFQERKKASDDSLALTAKRLNEAERPIIADLNKTGTIADSVWDLVNRSEPYPEALPVLLRHLQMHYPDPIREGIARALAIPDAAHAWPVIVAEYKAEPAKTRAKAGLACALAATAHDGVIDDLILLAEDQTNGTSRVLLLSALKRSRSSSAHETLRQLADDPDVSNEIRSWGRGWQRRLGMSN